MYRKKLMCKLMAAFLSAAVAVTCVPSNVLLRANAAGIEQQAVNAAFGSAQKELSPGEYILPTALKNAGDPTKDSMAASCVKDGRMTVNADGTADITIGLQAVSVFGVTAWASDWKVYKEKNEADENKTAAAYTQNEDGNVDSITFCLPDNAVNGVYTDMFVSAMNTTMSAYFAFDFANVQAVSKPFQFGSAQKELSPGEYTLPTSLKNAGDLTKDSMAASCVKDGQITVNADGTADITIGLQAVSAFGMTAWAESWKVYKEKGEADENKTAAEYTQDEEGNVDSITFCLPDNALDGVYTDMFVSAMNTTMSAYFAFDFANAQAAGSEPSVEKKTGTARVEQFGEYNVNVTVSVQDGKIADLEVTGDDFSGTYAEFNKTKLQEAVDGLKTSYIGKSVAEAAPMEGIDAVSGATYSSDAIRTAVFNALGLKPTQEVITLPTEKLAEGTYEADIAFYTDNVKHSLVENDKAKATITVDAQGSMTLTTAVINGTVKEPLYFYDFNGYYEGNDRSGTLKTTDRVKKEDIDFTDDVFGADEKVVTEVSFPLEGDFAAIYNTRASIYVPAMKNLTGEVGGVVFDQGRFQSDCFAKIYWDSLERISAPAVDKTALNTLIETAQAESARTEVYTAETIANLKTAIANAYAVAAKEDAAQEEVQAQITALNTAIQALQRRPEPAPTNRPSTEINLPSVSVTPSPTPGEETNTPTPTPGEETNTPTPTPGGETNTPTPTPGGDVNTPTPTPKPDPTVTPKPTAKPGQTVKAKEHTYKVLTKGTAAFSGSKKNLKAVTVPAVIKVNGTTYKVTTITRSAMKNNTKLTRIVLGKNVTSIAKNAFKDCRKLKVVRLPKGISKKRRAALKKQLRKAGLPSRVVIK